MSTDDLPVINSERVEWIQAIQHAQQCEQAERLARVVDAREHKTTRRYAKLYQLLALVGWVLFVLSLFMQPASAATMGEAVAIFAGGWILLSVATAYTLCCLVRRAKRHDRG